jgi:aminopeptidase N
MIPVPYLNTAKQLQIIYSFKRVKMKLVLNATPKQALYFVGSEAADDLQIWTRDKGNIPAIGFRVLMM